MKGRWRNTKDKSCRLHYFAMITALDTMEKAMWKVKSVQNLKFIRSKLSLTPKSPGHFVVQSLEMDTFAPYLVFHSFSTQTTQKGNKSVKTLLHIY